MSQTVLAVVERIEAEGPSATVEAELAKPIPISLTLVATVEGVSDEHRAQLLLRALS